MKLDVSQQYFVKHSISKLMIIYPLGAKVQHADGMGKHDETNSCFHVFFQTGLKHGSSAVYTHNILFAGESTNDNKPLKLVYL
jgi:hypothetical protein